MFVPEFPIAIANLHDPRNIESHGVRQTGASLQLGPSPYTGSSEFDDISVHCIFPPSFTGPTDIGRKILV